MLFKKENINKSKILRKNITFFHLKIVSSTVLKSYMDRCVWLSEIDMKLLLLYLVIVLTYKQT